MLQLRRNRNALRTFAQTLAAADAVVGLTVGRDCPSVARQVGLAEPRIVLLFLVLRECSLVDAFVVVGEYSRNVDSERARHAVLAGRALDRRIVGHDVRNVLAEIFQLFFRQWLESLESLQVVLEMLHVDHSAQDGQDPRVGTGEAEGPGCHGGLRVALLEPVCHTCGGAGKTASQKRFHHHDRDLTPVKLLVQVVGIDVSLSVGMLPVPVVHLDLDEIPVVFVV